MINIKILKDSVQTHGAKFETQAEADAWVALQESKPRAWGHKKDRWLSEEDLLAEGKVLADAENTRIIPGVYNDPDKTEYFLSKEYEIVQEDLSQNPEYILEQVMVSRKKAYPSMDEILHIILDHGIDSPEFAVLQEKCQLIKAKYAKE